MVESQPTQVSFCIDFSQPADVVIAPLTENGFAYPIPTLNIDFSDLPALEHALAFGNIVDFGADRESRRVFGVFVSSASDWEDQSMLIQTLQYGIYNISAAIGTVATVAFAPVSETEDWEQYLYYQLESVLTYLKPRKLLICAQSQEARNRMMVFLSSLQQQYSLTVQQTRSAAEEEMRKSDYSCQICHEYAFNAYRSQCCESVVCDVCAKYQHHCPKCTKPVSWQESKFVRERVQNLVYVCRCEDAFPISEEGAHLVKCSLAQFICMICVNERRIPLTRADFKEHLMTNHKERVEQDLMDR